MMIPIDCHLDGLLHRPWLARMQDDSGNVASPTSAASLQKQQAALRDILAMDQIPLRLSCIVYIFFVFMWVYIHDR